MQKSPHPNSPLPRLSVLPHPSTKLPQPTSLLSAHLHSSLLPQPTSLLYALHSSLLPQLTSLLSAQHGRANQNPTVAEALKSTQTLRVVDSVWVDDLTGSNCRGRKRKRKFLETKDCKPLPKRRKRRPSM